MSYCSILIASGEFRLRFNLLIKPFAQENTSSLEGSRRLEKFGDHLPPYRQEKIFGLVGLTIARSTLVQWVGQTGVQLQALVDTLREQLLTQGVIHADETPMAVFGGS